MEVEQTDSPVSTKKGKKAEAGARKEKKWVHFSSKTYQKIIGELVTHNGKTVNTNVEAVGIRLSENNALDEPYVSGRTLIADGVSLSLDYTKNITLAAFEKAAAAKVRLQADAVMHKTEFAQSALPEEHEAIAEALHLASQTPFYTGTEFVDHHLRQIILPKEDVEDGYVVLTPITAGGINELLFRPDGVVARHNETCEGTRSSESEKSESETRRIRRAHLGIGGSNPQNAGGLVPLMRYPVLVDAPQKKRELRIALSIYHRGLSLDFSRPGEMHDSLLAYAKFRSKYGLDGTPAPGFLKPTSLPVRQEEERLITEIARTLLDKANEAHSLLADFADMLPREINPETGEVAVVSPKLQLLLRALIDPSLRDNDWPRAMAWHLMGCMEAAVYPNDNHVIALDTTATATVVKLLEASLR